MVTEQNRLHFFPFGSRRLSLTLPAERGSDVWLIERWLNRVQQLQPRWYLQPCPERGALTGQVLLQLRQLTKRLLVWQTWQIDDLTYSLFGLELDQSANGGRLLGLRPLSVGDSGGDVLALQNRLAVSNRRYALILGRPADGDYDQRTARAVRIFQRESQLFFPGVRVTGQALGDTMLAVWDRTILGGRVLAAGARGLDVLALQELLVGLRHPVGLSGVFGEQTAESLVAWQKQCGLPPTGVFGAADCWRLGLARGY